MFCSRCGTWAPDDTATCPLCGLALQVDNWSRVTTASAAPVAPAIVPILAYAGFWRRMIAAVLDSIVLFFPAATVRVLVGLPASGMFDPMSPGSWAANTFDIVLDGLYAVLFLCSPAQATLGMQVMDLKLTDLKGGRVSAGRAIGRYLAQLLSVLTFGIGYIIQPFTPRRQMLHDIVAGTLVLRPRPDPTRVPPGVAVTPAPVVRLVP